MHLDRPLARRTDILSRDVDDDLVAYDLRHGVAHSLNATTAFVYRRADGDSSLDDIATLMASGLRWIAVVPALTGLALAAAPERYDVFVDREGVGAMVRGRDGSLSLLGKPSRFVVEQWLRADGDSRNPKDKSLRVGTHCDGAGCVARAADGRSIALDQDSLAI